MLTFVGDTEILQYHLHAYKIVLNLWNKNDQQTKKKNYSINSHLNWKQLF